MKSLELIKEEILKDPKNAQIYIEHHCILEITSYRDKKWMRVRRCTKCKHTEIIEVDENYITHRSEIKCGGCGEILRVNSKEVIVKSTNNIIKLSEDKLSIYTWAYCPRLVWPAKNKKPTTLRILRVNGTTISKNGCYSWKFARIGGKRVIKSGDGKRDRNILKMDAGSSVRVLHAGFNDQYPVSSIPQISRELMLSFLNEASPSFGQLKLTNYSFPLSKRIFDAARGGTKTLIKAVLGRNEPSLIKAIAKNINDNREPSWLQLIFLCKHIKDINILRNSINCGFGHIFIVPPVVSVKLKNVCDRKCGDLVKLLKIHFSANAVVKFIESMPVYQEIGHVDDTHRMFNRLNADEKIPIIRAINNEKMWTINNLHDKCTQFINRERQQFQPRKIDESTFVFDDNIKKFELNKESVKIVLPKDPQEMLKWGNELHNCVYSYHDMVRSRMSVVLGLFIDEKLTACIEIKQYGIIDRTTQRASKNVTQFRGVNNSKIFDELYGKNPIIKEWFDDHKFEISGNEREQLPSSLAREYRFQQQNEAIERVWQGI
jgi:ribosomal protein S27E